MTVYCWSYQEVGSISCAGILVAYHTTVNNIFLYIHDFFTSGRKGSRADEEGPDPGISYEVLPAGAGEMPEVRTL